MTFTKRLRVLWAALSQEWHQHTCLCGATCWIEGRQTWAQQQCSDCESRQMAAWADDYQTRNGAA